MGIKGGGDAGAFGRFGGKLAQGLERMTCGSGKGFVRVAHRRRYDLGSCMPRASPRVGHPAPAVADAWSVGLLAPTVRAMHANTNTRDRVRV